MELILVMVGFIILMFWGWAVCISRFKGCMFMSFSNGRKDVELGLAI